MISTITILAIGVLTIISYQDLKERWVYWFLFPLLGLALSILHYATSTWEVFALSVLLNMFFVSSILIILYIYTVIFTKRKFLNVSFGMGDLFFFYAFAFGFPTITFIILLVFSIFFALLTFFTFKKSLRYSTIPLAGYQSIFLILIFILNLFFEKPTLYVI